MKKIITVLIIMVFIGCSETKVSTPTKNINTIEQLNKTLPKQIDKDTKLLLVTRKVKNKESILIYHYQLINYEKELINFNVLKANIYNEQCPKELKYKKNITTRFVYEDRYFNHIGEMSFGKNICNAMKYIFTNDPMKFKEYLYSLTDNQYMNLELDYSSLSRIFSDIYIDRLGDVEIK